MRLSTYTITVPDYPEPGSYLLYNGLTEAMVVIGQELKEVLDCLDHPAELTGEALEHLAALQELGLVVDEKLDERKLVVHTFERMKHNIDNLSIMVCPTYYCNFKCVYCVEETVKEQDIYMNDEVAQATIAWIKSYTEATRPKNLSLRFYGGEPLLNVPMMEFVSKEIFEYARSKDLKFVIGITTNGALLTEAVVDKLVPYGLKYVKITLDGDKEAHDKKRPYLSGKGTFDRIIKNIKAVSNKIMINIGGNFDEENADSMLRLLAFMKETGIGDKIGTFDFKPIMDTIDRRDAERTAAEAATETAHTPLPDGMIPIDIPILNDTTMPGCGSHSKAGSHSMSEGNIPEAYVTMKRAIAAHGFRTPPGVGQVSCAMTMSETAFIVDPVGKIYNCPPLVGREQFSVGDVWNGLNHRFVEFMTLDVWRNDMCLDCTYVPMCGSGCRYEAYLKTGDIYAPDCEKAYFDKAVPELIKFDYEVVQAQRREQTDAFEERSFA